MQFLLTLNIILIVVLAYYLGRFGWRRGLVPELVTACGILIAYFIFDLFARIIIIGGLNLLLTVASAVVGRVQGAAPGAINYAVDYDKLTKEWQRGLNIFSFIFLAIIAYIAGSRLVKTAGSPAKPAKSWLGAVLGALNGLIGVAALFSIAGAPDFTAINWRFTIPSIDIQVFGTNQNPLQNWTIWAPYILVGVVFLLLLNTLSKGFPTKTVTRTRLLYVVGIAVLVALVITFATINRKA